MFFKIRIFICILILFLVFPKDNSFSFFEEQVSNFIVEAGDSTATLSWENPISTEYAGTMILRGASNFEFTPEDGKVYYFGEEVSSGVVVIYYSTGNTFYDSPLRNGDKYVYQAFAFDYDVNYSEGSTQKIIYPEEDTENPNAPMNLEGISGNESIYLTWEESTSADVDKYNVYCEDVELNALFSQETRSTEYLFEGLENEKTYDCWVTAIDYSNNESVPSNNVSVLVGENNDSEPPLPIMDLSGVLENNKIVLSWTKNYDEDLAYYKIYIDSSDGDEEVIIEENSLYIFDQVSQNTTYYFEVTSVDLSGNESEKSNQVEIYVADLDSNLLLESDSFVLPPRNLTGEFSDRQLYLSWNGEVDYNYNLFKRCGINDYYTKINRNLIYETNYIVSDLVSAERCEFFVKAINFKGKESAPSNIFFLIIPDLEAQISEVTGVNLLTGNNQIAVDFRDSSDPDLNGYNIYLNGKLLSPPSPFRKSYVVLSDLNNGQEYNLKITVLDNYGNESSGISFEVNPPDSHTDQSFLGVNENDDKTTDSLADSVEVFLDEQGLPNISWDLDDSNTIAGYNIYRGELGRDLIKLNQNYLVTDLPFIDTETVAGEKYSYQVASVDFEGAEKFKSKILQISSNDSTNLGYFKDVIPGNPFFDYVEKLRKKNIVKGYPGHFYKPYQSISRIESLKIVMQVAGVDNDPTLRFHDYYDVDKNAWSYPYIEKATFEGIIKGYTDGLFRPNQNISRVEFLKMMMNAGQIAISKVAISPFKDDKGFWGTEYIGSAYNLGIISGYANNEFRPNNPISRAEAAKIVYALFGD